MSEPELRWQFGPPLDCFDRGFQFGDGVFETIDYAAGGAWLPDQHRARLSTAAERLGLVWPTGAETDRLLEAIEVRARGLPRAAIKLFLSAAPTRRGYGRPWPHPALLRASVTAIGPLEPTAAKVAIIDQPLLGSPALDGLKHLNRLPQVLAGSAQLDDPGSASQIDERLVYNGAGTVEEGTFTNVFYQLNGRRFTPPIRAGVAGALRAALLNEPDLALSERALGLAELPMIERCWIGNSLMGLRPVVQLNHGQRSYGFPVDELSDPLLRWMATSRVRDRQPLLTLCTGLMPAEQTKPLIQES
ncbi:MAG: aminotransferase class IV [Pseudomonadota bacterium]